MKRHIALFFFTFYMIQLALPSRAVISFNEDWTFYKGPFPADPVLFSNMLTQPGKKVNLPHTWNAMDMQNDKNNFYAGEAYYRKTFVPDASSVGKRIFLRFEGVASTAEVYVNNRFAGNHKGGYSAFAVEITNLLDWEKENTILVKADNASRPDVIPVNHTLFGVYGGIYRPVSLIVTDKVNIAVTDYASPGVYISQRNVSKKSADITIKVKVDNLHAETKQIKLLTTIFEADGITEKAKQEQPATVSRQGRHTFEQAFRIKSPRLWQGLEDPYLYKTLTQIIVDGRVVDEVAQPLGIRHFELKQGDGMYLNGKKVPMYGVCRHQDWWRLGSALTDENHRTDLEIIKEIGATTIRFAHYQQAEYIYAKCDSIGFMVWAEIPFVNRVSTKEGDNARQQLIELIRQNYNHPSIYIWGLHNEVYTPYNYTVALTSDLHDLAKTEDPDRYTVSVSGYSKVDQASNLTADIQGINHYFGWYSRKISDVEDWVKSMEKDFPTYKVIFSEYGAEANIDHQQEEVGEVGDCCGFDKRYNETFATKFHEMHWGVIAEHPYLLASYVWNTFDFATPMSSQGGVEARNMKGLVTFDRKVRKDPFYWYKANWSKEPVLYLTQRRAVQRQNQTTPVAVYSNIGVPRLFVNGQEITDFRMGNTNVHYIFEDVKLNEGQNKLEARAGSNGKSFEDTIYWNYSSETAGKAGNADPEEKKKEHIGL